MERKKIAALAGDYYHKPDGMTAALAAVADALGCDLDAFTDTGRMPWDALREYQALVIARENRVAPVESPAVWATPSLESAIAQFTEAGGALVALHSGLASFDEEGPYLATVRGSFQYHPREHPRFTVRAITTDHPAAAGLRSFELKDEMYFVRVDSARTARLLEVAHPDYGASCAAWAHESGRGRVFCFTPGHRAEVLRDPGYRATLEAGLRWALRLS